MEIILGKNRNGPLLDTTVFAAFSKSMIVDIESKSNDIYIRMPDIKIDIDRLKDFESDL